MLSRIQFSGSFLGINKYQNSKTVKPQIAIGNDSVEIRSRVSFSSPVYRPPEDTEPTLGDKMKELREETQVQNGLNKGEINEIFDEQIAFISKLIGKDVPQHHNEKICNIIRGSLVGFVQKFDKDDDVLSTINRIADGKKTSNLREETGEGIEDWEKRLKGFYIRYKDSLEAISKFNGENLKIKIINNFSLLERERIKEKYNNLKARYDNITATNRLQAYVCYDLPEEMRRKISNY